MKYLVVSILNIMWFGFFMYLIVFKNYSLWLIVIPMFTHWTVRGIERSSFDKESEEKE